MKIEDNQLYVELKLKRFPYELLIKEIWRLIKFRFWLYPKAIKAFFQIKKDFKVA